MKVAVQIALFERVLWKHLSPCATPLKSGLLLFCVSEICYFIVICRFVQEANARRMKSVSTALTSIKRFCIQRGTPQRIS